MARILYRTLQLALALVLATIFSFHEARADGRPDLVIAVNKLPRGLEPARYTGNVDVRGYYSIFDPLIRRDFLNPMPDGSPRLVPHLAVSWKRINPRTLELKLRKGVKFHNGDEFTADDVVFTFSKERLRGKKAVIRKGRNYFGHVKKVKKIDKYTVRFITKEPDLVLEHRLSTYTSFIINARSWLKYKKKGKKKWLKKAYKKNIWKPVGTGPYKFVGWKKNQFVKLAANDDYFMGKPAAKTITFKAVPEVATRIAGLVSGEFDIVVDVPPDQFAVLKRYKDIKTKTIVLENTHVLVFNTKHPVLKDKRIRQALSLAIDRDTLRKSLWLDMNYTPNGHQLKIFGPMYNPKRKGYVYDPEKAKKLLAKSSYKGEVVSYRLIPNYYLNALEAAQIILEMWKKIGFKARLEMVENFKQVRAGTPGIYAWSNTYRLPDPAGAIDILWGKRSAVQRKYKFFAPPKAFNKALQKIKTGSDMKERYRQFQKVLDMFEDLMPMTMLYNPLVTYALRKNIEWTPYTLYFMDFRPYNLKIRK